MLPKLRTMNAFAFATILSTISLATVLLWTKSCPPGFLKTQRVTCDHAYGTRWCTLRQGNSSIDLITQENEPLRCMRTMLMAPRSMTFGANCSNGTVVVPATCAFYLREVKDHYCTMSIHITRNWVPSKVTITIWVMASIISIVAVTYIFRQLQKRQASGTIARIPHPNPKASISLACAAEENSRERRSYLHPSTWTDLWARKSGSKINQVGEYY